jgi:hypothetical protein
MQRKLIRLNWFWGIRIAGILVVSISVIFALRLWNHRENLNYFELKWGGVFCFLLFFAGIAAVKIREDKPDKVEEDSPNEGSRSDTKPSNK